MSARVELVGGGVAIVALLLAFVVLRQDDAPAIAVDDSNAREPRARERPAARAEAPAEIIDAPALEQAPPLEQEPPLEQAPPLPAAPERDATGELLSSGPAQVAALPERPADAQDNVPEPEELQAIDDDVLARLEADIAAARARGDAATADRLEVRRARLERKRAAGI